MSEPAEEYLKNKVRGNIDTQDWIFLQDALKAVVIAREPIKEMKKELDAIKHDWYSPQDFKHMENEIAKKIFKKMLWTPKGTGE